jgi:hypothetical protein
MSRTKPETTRIATGALLATLLVAATTGIAAPRSAAVASPAAQVDPAPVSPQVATGSYSLPPRNDQNPRVSGAVDVSGPVLVVGQRPVGAGTSGSGGAHIYRAVGGTWELEASLVAPVPSNGSRFGEPVAISGDTVVVGAPNSSLLDPLGGAAYVYRHNGAAWLLEQELVPAVRRQNAHFGTAVDIDGDTAIVSEPLTSTARVFTRVGTTWTEQQAVVVPGSTGGWLTGYSVAVKGDTAVIGASLAATTGPAAGAAYVYVRKEKEWSLQATLTADVPVAGANFGYDVAVDGDQVLVGAYTSGTTGAAYSFRRIGEAWGLKKVMTPTDADTRFYGRTVAIEGGVAAVGAYGFPASAVWTYGFEVALDSGVLATTAWSAQIPYSGAGGFETRKWNGAAWSTPTVVAPLRNEAAGAAIDVDGSVTAVGVPGGWTGSGVAGYVVLSYWSGKAWTSSTQVLRPTGASGDRFGAAVALQGSTLAVGVPGAGVVEIYSRSGTSTTWDHVQTLSIAGVERADEFGIAVALDGDRLVIGAPGDDEEGTDAGAVFVSERSGTFGPLVRAKITDAARAGDDFGRSVSVAGGVAVAGAPGDDTNGSNAGAVARLTSDGDGGWHTATAADLLTPAGSGAGDAVGTSVAASSTYLVTGAPGAAPSGSSSGEAWVFRATGVLVGRLSSPGGAAGDGFGQAVATDGIQIAASSPGDDGSGSDSGSVSRFIEKDRSFQIQGTHVAPDAGAEHGFGRSIALHETDGWLAAGAPSWDGATPELGRGYVFGFEPPAGVQGELRVTTSPAVASTIVVDGEARDQWGLTWLDIDPGPHEVCFTNVPGFVTPPCEDVAVTGGQTTTVTGTFIQMATLQVVTSPAVASTITIRDVTNGGPAVPSNKWGVFSRVVPDRTLEICFGPVAGWDPPPCQTVVATDLQPGEFKQVTGTFTEDAGASGPAGKGELRVTTNPAIPATITIDGIPRDEWGLTWLELDPGTYEVCATDVPARTSAPCFSATVSAGEVTEHTIFTQAMGYVRVLTSPAVEATLYIDGVARNDWGVWLPMANAGHEVCFGRSRPGGTLPAPACQTVAGPAPGTTQTVTGTYP